MTNKTLVLTLSIGTLLLTACGGGGDSENYSSSGDKNPIKSNVDYNKSETIDLITEPVVSLSKKFENPVIDISTIAIGIHYQIIDPKNEGYKISCESGTIQKNSNGSITLNNCKNYKINNIIDRNMKNFIFSGTIDNKINNNETLTQMSSRYEITLSDFSIKNIDGELIKLSGKIIQNFMRDKTTGIIKAQFDVDNMENKWIDQEDNGRNILTNYHLVEISTESSMSALASGTLQGDENGQKYSVKFDSKVEYPWSSTFAPTIADINIEDSNNLKNAVTIKNTIGGKASINAFANGTSVSGYPKTVNWDYFE
jgi:hypothetical protein